MQGGSSPRTWHAPGMTVGAREHFVPAASVGRREEERQRTVCRELRGGCVELRGCLYEQEQHRRGPAAPGALQVGFYPVEVKNSCRAPSFCTGHSRTGRLWQRAVGHIWTRECE